MSTVLLVRHARTAANSEGVLAGWTPGVGLDEAGLAQAGALAQRLDGVPLAGLVSSPLERCLQTAAPLAGARGLPVEPDERLGECRYGDWTGQQLKRLAKDPLWKVVQQHPSGAVFPGASGESLRAMSQRAVDAVRGWDAHFAAAAGDGALWVAISHGDVIKAVVADALGLHLDGFQRIVVDPCSVTVVRYTPLRPFLVRLNDVGADLRSLVPPRRRRRRRARAADSDAVVGGGAGPTGS